MYRIGEFSKLSKTTVKALRYYDEVGLLKPEYVDEFTGYRFYKTNQLFDIYNIIALRQIGLSVDEIKLAMKTNNINEILAKRKAEILDDIALYTQQLSRVEFILSENQEDNTMNYQAIVKDLPEVIVASKTGVVSGYDKLSDFIVSMQKKLETKYPDVKCTNPPYCFTKYLDNEYKDTDIKLEYCEAINKIKDSFEDIEIKKIPSVKVVSVLHKGSYEAIGKAYAYVFSWMEENGYVKADSARESYIDGFWNNKPVEEFLTEVQVPVIKK